MRAIKIASAGLCWLAATAATEPMTLTIDVGREYYPAEALAMKLEGEVPITVKVSETGELRCTVAPGGALVPLKRPSCALVASRNIFVPPVRDGKPVAQDYAFVVRWHLASSGDQFGGAIPIGRAKWITYGDYPPIARRAMLTGKVDLAFDITAFGRVENCKVTRTNSTKSLADGMCPLIVERAMFLPALTPDGTPRATRGTLKTEWTWCDDNEWRRCTPPDLGVH